MKSNPLFKSGFSFVEVVVALVILSMSLIILMESQTRSMDLVSRARTIDDSVTLASAKLTEITQKAEAKGIDSLKPEENGDFDQDKYPGFHWKYRVASVPPPDFVALFNAATGGEAGEENKNGSNNGALFAGPLQQISKLWAEGVKEIHLEVSWKDGNREKTYELVTHLINSNASTNIQGFVGGLTGGGKP